MLSVKQGGIKYHFLNIWYNSTWDWTPVSRTISEDSTNKATGSVDILIFFFYVSYHLID